MRARVRGSQRYFGSLWVQSLLFWAAVPPSVTQAAVVCYDESRYPAIVRLDRTENGLRAVPAVRYEATGDFPLSHSAVLFTESGGWQPTDSSCKDWKDCRGRQGGEGFPGPAITLSIAEAIKLRPSLAEYWGTPDGYLPPDAIEQNIGGWTEHDGKFWFGISFYDGEGTSGVGGVGRFDPKTGQMDIRRPSVISDSSVDHIVYDGRSLWFSTDANHECLGNETPHGLARYDWDAARLETFEGRDDGPCGFTVNDLAIDDKFIWVATDLGLSRRDRSTGTWEHFVPDPDPAAPMRPATCEALYTKLLGTLPRAHDESADVNFYSQLFQSLAKFRPRFLAGYVKSIPPEKWGCDELDFLGRSARDLAALRESVLEFRSAGGEDVGCALNAFGDKKVRDPEWRDLLLALLESPRQQSDVLYMLQHFAPDAKIGEVLVRRLSTADNPWQEAELLPSMIGKDSVPVLFSALDRYRHTDQPHIVRHVISALMNATRTVIDPDGKESRLDPGASPQTCLFGCPIKDETVLRVADFWKTWWNIHKQESCIDKAEPAARENPCWPSELR